MEIFYEEICNLQNKCKEQVSLLWAENRLQKHTLSFRVPSLYNNPAGTEFLIEEKAFWKPAFIYMYSHDENFNVVYETQISNTKMLKKMRNKEMGEKQVQISNTSYEI